MQQTANPAEATATTAGRRLTSAGFGGLLITQCLGAINDNLFRWLAVPIGVHLLGDAEALTLGAICFTLPYLLLASIAGFLADRFDKRSVIVGCKVAEIGLMLLGSVAMLYGHLWLLFGVVALMGCQSALFSPSKFGSIPELVGTERISAGNGVMGLVTVVASALGTFGGYALYELHEAQLTALFGQSTSGTAAEAGLFGGIAPVMGILLGVAVAGWLASLAIPRLQPADPSRRLPPNPAAETWHSLRLLASDVPLLRTALGIAFFWFLASLAQVNVNVYGRDVLHAGETEIGILLVLLVAGVGLGSVLAGWWSGGRVELGIVPLGAAGIALSACLLWVAAGQVDAAEPVTRQQAWWWSSGFLFVLGVSAGLFNVPLESLLQRRSELKTRGMILAASNFLSFSLIMLASVVFYVLHKILGLSGAQVFLAAGLGTLPVLVYIVLLLPDATIRFLVWLMSHTAYRVRVYGRENIPDTGGALLVSNHISWLDGIMILLASSRPIRMLAYADYVENPWLNWLARIFGVIPIKAEAGPKEIMRSLRAARQAVENGELVCIFAEGQISRTGQLQPFQRGLLRIVQGTRRPVIPVYLDELWGSVFSFRGGKFFWKKPTRWPYPVSIHFGQPLDEPETAVQVRQAVEQLGVTAMIARKSRQPVPPQHFVRQCRRSLSRVKVADSTGAELTGGRLLAGAVVMQQLLRRRVLTDDEQYVGVLLPPSAGGVVVNAALALCRRVAVNLNYTLSDEVVNSCIRQCGMKHILTSRRFLQKKPMELEGEIIYLEDLKEQVTGLDKLIGATQAYVCPSWLTERLHGLHRIDPDDLLTIIFTSGSTGEPKGVMLSPHNVMSNMSGVDQLFHLSRNDVLLGVLPFFHSFGFTGTLWLPMVLDPKAVYHFNPLDARTIGKLSAKHGVTVTMATPTFLRTWLKRCTPEQLKTLNLVITGAEKLPRDLADEFQAKMGIELTEGYGTTELSPVAAANVPASRTLEAGQVGAKPGTVGRPFPGVSARVVDPDTREDLGTNAEGLLLISGPNVMQGYLNQPDKTAEVISDGWYNTGDFARIDDDGFIEITGRQSRFSKIGGEMVPHIRIEEHLCRIVDGQCAADSDNATESSNADDEGCLHVAVTSVPDPRKGERLVVVHRRGMCPVDQVLQELASVGLPNLWLPSADSFLEVEEIPVLGTGKLDLKALKDLALGRFGPAPEAAGSVEPPVA